MPAPETFPGPAYRVLTSRLVIRSAGPADTAVLHAAIQESRNNLLPWMAWANFEPVSFQERLEYLRNVRGEFNLGKNFEYLIFDLAETIFLGAIGLHKRTSPGSMGIGYWVHSKHLNQGFATEAAGALTRVAFEIERVDRVQIECDPENMRSAAVARKLGFTHEATLHARIEDATPTLKDAMIWSLFAGDYPSSPAVKIAFQAFDALDRRIF